MQQKTTTVVPTHKKEDKTLIKNYYTISLPPSIGKIFEGVIINFLFNDFQSDKLSQYTFSIRFSSRRLKYCPVSMSEIQTLLDNNPTV